MGYDDLFTRQRQHLFRGDEDAFAGFQHDTPRAVVQSSVREEFVDAVAR